MSTLNRTQVYTPFRCRNDAGAGCARVFYVEDDWLTTRCNQGGIVACPYCGTKWDFSMQSATQKLRDENARLARLLEIEEARVERERVYSRGMRRKAAALRGVVTRTKNRVGNGVCPCCNRTFANLMRHMHDQHPGYTAPPKPIPSPAKRKRKTR